MISGINDEYEPIINNKQWLENAPFKTIHYFVRFGENATKDIYFSRVSKKYDELPIASQMPMRELHDVFLDRKKLHEFLEPGNKGELHIE